MNTTFRCLRSFTYAIGAGITAELGGTYIYTYANNFYLPNPIRCLARADCLRTWGAGIHIQLEPIACMSLRRLSLSIGFHLKQGGSKQGFLM